ncbi:MAG TPA: endonuclease [Flavobacteriales bacterium]|nr:endonuclease [Flavobacteriales bacterium]
MAHVYVLYSKTANRHYIGSCKHLSDRLKLHREKVFSKSFTSVYDDWELVHQIGDLTYSQARQIERHIKRMKSRKYIENLTIYPEITNKLLQRYPPG